MNAVAEDSEPKPVRLQVLLARCGLGSRRACEEFVSTGRVTVDGNTVTEQGARVDPEAQTVCVDGEPIRPERPAYYMVNKSKGVLCTNKDPAGRARVIDMFPDRAGRLFTIGRLDENSVGLLLVTNDGELSHRLAHPKFRVPKTYRIHVAGNPTQETLKKLREGLYFSNGRFRIERARRITTKGKSTILEVVLNEGQNREVRRLFARVGHKVMRLERVSFGPLKLRGVAAGRYRKLSRDEIRLLRDYVERGEKRSEADRPRRGSAGRGTKGSKGKRKTAARSVEVSPVSTASGRDLTGRRRKSGGRPHPAVAKASRKKRK